MPRIYGECGYEIHREGDETLLVNRRSWGLGYAMGMFGILVLILVVVGVFGLVGASDIKSEVPLVALFGVAAACAALTGLMFAVYRARCGLPAAELPGTCIIDHGAGVLRGSGYDVLARLDSIRVAVKIDWWTRGWMRLVVFTWPGGRRTVFRSPSRQRARIVAEALSEILGR